MSFSRPAHANMAPTTSASYAVFLNGAVSRSPGALQPATWGTASVRMAQGLGFTAQGWQLGTCLQVLSLPLASSVSVAKSHKTSK